MQDSASYQLIFDVARTGYRHWWFSGTGLIISAVGCFDLLRARTDRRRRRIGTLVALGGAAWTAIAFFTSYQQYHALSTALASGHYQVVEGRVVNFVRGDGRRPEAFEVQGHRFAYSWSVVSPGFNTQGVLGAGMKVRIADVDGEIARLEISR